MNRERLPRYVWLTTAGLLVLLPAVMEHLGLTGVGAVSLGVLWWPYKLNTGSER